MTEEFNLSKELIWIESLKEFVVLESRLKEFIRLLKERLCREKIKNETKESSWDRISQETIWEEINKLAGDKLK